jgi:4-hydroxy-3-polyprenylbenzoate decarboxylase
VNDVASFLKHILQRADWTRDLHFQTQTTIDTLDYSGSGLNSGSKVVIAAVGPSRFELATQITSELRLPEGFSDPQVVLPGVLAIKGPRYADALASSILPSAPPLPHSPFRLIVIVDDSQFVAESLRNFVWVTFTRTNPAADVHGIDAFVKNKHWGCRGSLIIDARLKPHHAPPLAEDPGVSRRVDSLAAPGGPLHGII